MSILNVNKINPVGSGSTVTIAGIASVTNNISVGNSVTASEFYGSLAASNLTGALPAISGANLTSLPSQVTIANNADNRVITGGSGTNLNGEANLTFSSNQLTVHEAKLKGNQLLFTTSGTAYLDHSTVGQDIQVRVSTSSSQDTTGPTFKSNGNLAFASGKGIDFSATSGTGTSEILTDYEEGTWTPDWRGASALGTTSYGSYNAASYVKVGNQVTVRGHSQITGSSGGSGFWFINNLPFTVGGGDNRAYRSVGSVMIENFNFNSDVSDVVCFIERNNNDMQLRSNRDNAGAGANISVNNDTSFDIMWTITYPTV